MEAVPKVPMLHFKLKQTQQKSSFARLKQYIAEYYQEDPETFSKEIYDLEILRAAAYNPSIDEAGYNVIKRYYCQLHSLQNRFPIEDDRNLVNLVWRDIYSNNTIQSSDLRNDMAVVLYNYGVLHTQVAAAASRSSEEEMKLVCTLFQRAAWAFEHVREKYQTATTGDMYPEILIFMQNICFAQAQECILEKSLMDNRKSMIVAKVASQIIEYYNSAFAALLSGGEEGVIAEIVGSKQFKEWRQYIQFKVQFTACILLLYQGQNAEEQQKMGERVTLYQAAFDRLEDARKEAKHLHSDSAQANEAVSFVMDIVEMKRKAAKNENEFIYHEEVPELSSIATIAGANLVKGIPLNVADSANEDIFHRLVPIKTHEHSSLYSEEKTNLLRRVTQEVEAKNNELTQFMESLNIDSLNHDPKTVKLPQSIVDRCASMNARPMAINDLIQNMSSLAEICVDVENMLQTIQELLSKEEFHEKDFQQTMGYRPSSHFIELNREFIKYQEAHNKAGDSNDTLRKAMEMHVNKLRILSKPLAEVHAAIPTCSVEFDPKVLSKTQMLLNKVNEMQVQRAQLYATLSENIQRDDITAQLVAWGEEDVEKLFKSELAKHAPLINIIEQNLVAQDNILKTFTDAYAKCAHFIKAVSETKHKRDVFFSSLIAAYDVYDDLLGKSLKGLEFYKKLQSNIHKLYARVRSARDVYDEERQQRIDSMNKKAMSTMQPPSKPSSVAPMPAASMAAPITDYTSVAKPIDHEVLDNYRRTAIRPTPIGQENTGIQSNCIAPMNTDMSHMNPAPASAAYNYGYQPQVAAPISSNYVPPTPAPLPTQAPTSMTSTSIASGYSNQPNAFYISQFSQPNAYAPSTGYVNPMYVNMPATSTLHQKTHGAPKPITPIASAAPNVGVYAPNMNGTQPNNYSSDAPQKSTQNVLNTSQPYVSHSQNDASPYMNWSYASGQAASKNPLYSHAPQTSIYQSPSVNADTSMSQSQSYMGAYSNYNVPSSQMNSYQQLPMSSQPQPQVSQQYSYSGATQGYVQSPQQITSPTSTHSNYTPQYPMQVVPPATTFAPAKEPQPTYDSSNYNYYNAQYPSQNVPSSNQYYRTDKVPLSNQYSTPLDPGYNMAAGYGAPTNTHPNFPSQANVYGYDAANPSGGGASIPTANNYTYAPSTATPSAHTYAPTSSMPSTIASNTIAPPKPEPAKQNSTKFDLLSDLENISIPAPTLQPIKSTEKSLSMSESKEESNVAVKPTESEATNSVTKGGELSSTSKEDSIEKALADLALAEEEANAKAKTDSEIKSMASDSAVANTASVPPSSSNIENFYKEVQRYEKMVNGLTTKTLNGTTPLEIKWKELHELLEKEEGKRKVSVSKLFPEKNRNMLSVPYDHSRVLLPTTTDNYINAAHIRDLGSHCNHFILADAPTFNTVKDFWCMIWSQQSSYVVCLSTPDEAAILLFPKQLNTAQHFNDYSVTVLTEQHRLFVIERSIRLTSSEANSSKIVTILQPKQWPSVNSIPNIIGVSQNVIDIITPSKMQNNPIIVNCLMNLERSSLVAVTITCILALESDTPMIINVTDLWYRICSQRRNILNDMSVFQQSMQIVLQCCREFIKKRSPKTLTNNTQTNYYFIEEEEIPVKDPFKDLDPLWKLK